jgi:PEP-CTERM motif
MKKLIVMVVIVLAFSGLTRASLIVKYDFGDGPNATLAPSEQDVHVSASNFGYSGDRSPMSWGGSEGEAYAVSGGWSAYQNFFDFTVTIDAGWELDVASLQFDSMTSYASGPKYAQVTYGANADVIATDMFIWGIGWTLGHTADNTPPTDLTGNVEFRIYAKSGLVSSSFFAVDNVALNGSVSQIPEPIMPQIVQLTTVAPEPATICVLGLGALGVIRRKKAA